MLHKNKSCIVRLWPHNANHCFSRADCSRTASVYTPGRGVARNLFRRGTKQGDWGQKSPSPAGSRGRALVVWGLEAEDIYANNHCNNVLTKVPYFFQHRNFRGGDISLAPPLPYAPITATNVLTSQTVVHTHSGC